MKYFALTATLLLATFGARAALADDDCNVPMADWQPREIVQKMAESRGWTVRRIKTDDGCYEIKARDANGNDIEVKVNPATLEILGQESEDGRGGNDDGDEEQRGGPNRRDAGVLPKTVPDSRPAPNHGVFNGASRPSAAVE